MSLPILDLDRFWADGRVAQAHARDLLGEALRSVGALTVRLPQPELGDRRLALLLGLFDLPESNNWEVARRSVRPDSAYEWVGYGFGGEKGALSHETFDLGSCGAVPVADVPGPAAPFYEVTPLPVGLDEGWLAAAEQLRLTLGDTGRELIRLLAQHLGRDEAAATDRFRADDSTMRILNYPPGLQQSVGPLRAKEHEDSGAFTFIWSDLPGLEVIGSDHDWVAAPGNTWTVLCGHVMSSMTDGAIGPTTHRVTGAPGRRRSLAYFFEPRRSASVLPWPAPDSNDSAPTPDEEYGRWLLHRHGG